MVVFVLGDDADLEVGGVSDEAHAKGEEDLVEVFLLEVPICEMED